METSVNGLDREVRVTVRRTVLFAGAAGLALLACATRPITAVGTLVTARDATDPTVPLVAAIALLAWSLTVWLLLAGSVTAASRLPGRLGRGATALCRRLAPSAVRRLLELTLGLSVGLGATPAAADSPPLPPPAASSFDWPAAATPEAAVALVAPVAPVAPPPGRSVVVQAGDSLWTIARGQLERGASNAQIAASWPRWWAANREVIGADPDLVQPGTRLLPPPNR